ncbi:hypothetical protein ACA910_014478 [Epithemia clementina (nom. ined.)]
MTSGTSLQLPQNVTSNSNHNSCSTSSHHNYQGGDNNGNHNDDDDETRRCRGCSSTALRVDWAAGDRVCTNCGLVDEGHLLEERPEWRDFDDDNDLAKRMGGGGGGASNRCGLVPNNEARWIGGLQPTSLSKYICGRASSTSHATRKQLIKNNQRMDRMVEKRHERDLKNAKLSIQIRKKQKEQQQKIRQRKRRRRYENGDEYEEEEEDDEEEENNHYNPYEDDEEGPDIRPELEHLLVQEEETALAATAALYSDKWSLDRAIRLFGSGHEVASLADQPNGHHNNDEHDDQDDHDATGDGLRQKLDSTLTNASQDLYAAYSMLSQCAQRLELPDRVTNEACALLCQYAARRDGFTVRGVSTQFKKAKAGTKQKPQLKLSLSSSSSKHQQQQQQQATVEEKRARESLRQFNKFKQIGSLVAALVFYTARNLNHARSLVQVCASVDTPPAVQEFLNSVADGNDDEGKKKDPFIKKKHCSKAMNEIRQVLPDFARSMAAATLPGSCGGASGTNGSADGTVPTASAESCVEHMARKLRLPPVAEASIRVLVAYCQKQDDNDDDKSHKNTAAESSNLLLDTRKRFIMCAAISYFICQMGEIMQTLAQQACASDNARPIIVPRQKKRKVEKRVSTGSSERDDGHGESTMNLFSDEDDAKAAAMEHRAYEMRRVWDAWREQTTWRRQLAEIERVADVSVSSVEEYFKNTLYPKRKALLEALANKSRLSAVAGGVEQGVTDSNLENVPLASVLLPHVTIAEPLIKESLRQKELWGPKSST